MDYLKNGFVIDDIRDGKKQIIATFSQFTALKGMEKSIARAYVQHHETISMGVLVARKQQPFETLNK